MSGQTGKFVAYYRVSTEGQGDSGLGLEAQKRQVRDYLGSNGWELVAEYEETGSGTDSDRPGLEKALRACRVYDATLIVAKLDRLTRDASLLHRLKDSGVEIRFANMPGADAKGITAGVLATVAEYEAEIISERTKAALQAKRERGEPLGAEMPECRNLTDEARQKGVKLAAEKRRSEADQRAADVAHVIEELRAEGATSLRDLAAGLEGRGVPTARGGQWHPTTVSNLLDRIEALEGD